MSSLKWKPGNTEVAAYLELTVLSVYRGFRLSFFDRDDTTYKEVNSVLRKSLTLASRIDGASFFPGAGHHDLKKTCGSFISCWCHDGWQTHME